MILDLLESTLPEWMFAAPRRHWSSLMAAVAVTMDGLMEGINQGRMAAEPGQVDADTAPNLGGFLTVDALPLIGRDRRIVRGLGETPDTMADHIGVYLVAFF